MKKAPRVYTPEGLARAQENMRRHAVTPPPKDWSEVYAKFPAEVQARYDFSKAGYTGALVRITGVVCPVHGEFSQYSAQFRKGAGCAACGGLVRVATRAAGQQQHNETAVAKLDTPLRHEDMPRTRSEAKQKGATHYFTGEPCKHGHVAARKTKGACVECIKIEWQQSAPARAAYRAEYNKSPAGQESRRRYYEKNKGAVIARALARPAEDKRGYQKTYRASLKHIVDTPPARV